ncbi:MAG: hypothetical protein ACK5WZ_15070, partial [Pseudobdellovibrionaceae bacterium]
IAFAQSNLNKSNKRMLFEHGHSIPLDLESSEYAAFLQRLQIRAGEGPQTAHDVVTEEDVLAFLIEKGARNADFLKFINSKKTADAQLAFTNAELQKKSGIPIDQPKTYSPAIIKKQLEDLRLGIPTQLGEIILGVGEMIYPLVVSDDDYLNWARQIDKLYQSAARWKMMVPYLDYLAERKQEDIRGFYFLNKEENLENNLVTWKSLPASDQARLSTHLQGLCLQNKPTDTCLRKLSQAVTQIAQNPRGIFDFYIEAKPKAEGVYNKFFNVVNPRPEAVWTSFDNGANSILKLPFQNPNNSTILDFLQVNIEDEWKFANWKLVLDFTLEAPVFVVFKPGVTPNVNGLGGNQITMDANQPITEFGTQWTIRHELGHVLGFPDCYIEFYDQTKKEMVSYQIDINNIMCSRAGRLQQIHVEQIQKNYSK